jgi:dipeptidyl aminopeptidase/acylaminoacyl peptidase
METHISSRNFRFPRSARSFFAAAILLAATGAISKAQQTEEPRYERPSKAILEVLNTPATPLASISPTREKILLYRPELYPPISEVSREFLRIAGLRIDVATGGPHNPLRFGDLALANARDGSETKVALPAEFFFSRPFWSPDGKHFAFTHATHTSIELWVADGDSGAARAVPGIRIDDALEQTGPFGAAPPCAWMPDSRSLLCPTVPAGRGARPKESEVPRGPRVEESFGKSAPVPTFEDLLEDAHDSDLFDYYATAQLALIDVASGKPKPLGKPGIFASLEPAPDGQHILVARIHRPYSYIVPAQDFPREVEVWDRAGRRVYTLANLPLEETVPMGGVPTGPRDYHWRSNAPSTLVWVEALDDGNPKKKVPQRDKILWIEAPFQGQPRELTRTEERFGGIEWGEKADFAILHDFNRDTLHVRTWFFDPENPSLMKLVWDLNREDRYANPGTPEMRVLPTGQRVVVEDGDFIYLSGEGASPQGDRPFLDRFDVKTVKAERLFHCDAQSYEVVEGLLAADGSKFLTRHESKTDPPNYFLHDGHRSRAITHYPDPTPQLRAIKKQIITYQRDDGVGLSMELYLPPDYREGERYPAVMWAYPLEYTDPKVASQVAGSPNRFTTILGPSPLFFLLDGYAVLDNAAMPVVGDPETVNNTYVDQIVADAKAAIDKAAEMGIVDPHRVGVGGHSYGAFMTANLLAHSDLFRAGIARSGAYNRTLTPFGFQNERRSLWQAPDVYLKMSPFMFADKIKTPILLIHGEADNNSGTFPMQSDRMFRAIKGNGGSVRYVTLPDEAHGYSARESIEDVLWEMTAWFDKWVKNAGLGGTQAAGEASPFQ